MIKAVILAGGNGVRMQPMTIIRPKPLLQIVDKTIIEHNLDSLDGLVKEVIIVIGYKGEMIRDLIKDRYKSMEIRYVVQENQVGTGDAAHKSIDFIDDKFILLNGDDLYSRDDIKNVLKRCPSILLGKVKNPSFFGVVECQDEYVKNLVEKPDKFPEKAMVNTGLYFLDKSIFDFRIQKSDRGEYEFTDYVRALLLNERIYFKEAKEWIPVSYPWNLLEANEVILSKIKKRIEGVVEKNCVIQGEVKIEKGVLIKSGSYLKGPLYIKKDSVIGPNSVIYGNTIIGEKSLIGSGVEIHNSVIGEKVSINSGCYIGDSIIGNNSYLESGVVLNNYSKNKKIKALVKDNLINTERVKFGSVLGDNVSIGSNSSLIPGVMIFSNTEIKSSSLITENIDEKK